MSDVSAPRMLGGCSVRHADAAARFILRGDAAVAAAAGPALGVSLPQRINRAEVRDPRAAVKLGPDEWLLIAVDAAGDEGAARLFAEVKAAIDGLPNSLVDVSHRQVGLLVEGEGAALALNAAVPLDLSDEVFPVGMATRTIFEKAEVVLWRQAPQAFRLEVWRSFAPYVEDLLLAVREENEVAA